MRHKYGVAISCPVIWFTCVFIPDSGMFEEISVTVNGEDFTGYLQQLGKKEGKQKGHLVIHGVDDDLEVVATFE